MTAQIDNKESVMELLAQHEEMLKQFGVQKIGIFGSFVRNNQSGQSDIDILVDFVPEAETFRNLMNLYSFLNSLFDRNIEVVTQNSLSQYIGPYILQEVEYVPFAS